MKKKYLLPIIGLLMFSICACNAEQEIDVSAPEYAEMVNGTEEGEDLENPSEDEIDRGWLDKITNSNLVDYRTESPNRSSPRRHKIDTITIHCMAGQLSVETCGNIYKQSIAMSSVNYAVDKDGRIGQYVYEKDRSWASSNSANDNRAVTIEVASDSSSPYAVKDSVYKKLIVLVADICQRNGIKKLVWSDDKNDRINHLNGANMTVHRDFAPNRACPGDYLMSKMPDIASQVNKKLGA